MHNNSCFHLPSVRQQGHQNYLINLMMSQDYQSHQLQLQSLTSCIQQQQQFLVNKVNQTISYQPAIDAIYNLANLYTQLRTKKSLKKQLQQQIQILQIQLHRKKINTQERKEKIKCFNDKMYIHVMNDVQAIRSLAIFSERNNIKTMMENHLSQFVYSYIHSARRCCHNVRKLNSNFYECNPGCQFGNLTQFMLEYKSENIYCRFKQLWFMMEKQLHKCISFYMRQFGQQILTNQQLDDQGHNGSEEIGNLKIQEMNMKVDLQIFKSQIKILCQSIGLSNFNQIDGEVTNSDCILLLRQSIQKFKSSTFYDGYNLYCQTALSEIAYVFYQYIDEVSKSYKTQNRFRIKTQQCQERFMSATISIFCEALQISLCIMEKKKQLQKRSVCLQKRMSEIKNYRDMNNSQIQLFKEDSSLIKPVCVSLESYSNRTTSQKDEISISVRYNRQSMFFRVLKTMHISNICNIQSSAVSKTSSRISSKTNSRVSSRSPIKNQRRSSRISLTILDNPSNQQFNERILQFGKNKLILRKQHPHFHEEIQLKRIQLIKIISFSEVNIYFKKGYMSIQFLTIQKTLPNSKSYINKVKAKKHLAREWVKCFKAVYYQQADSIVFQQNQDLFCEGKDMLQMEQLNNLLKRKSILQNEFKEKENIQQNFNTFAEKNEYFHKKIILEPQLQGDPYTSPGSMLKKRIKVDCLF